MDKDEIIKELTEKNAKLEQELLLTKEHLKKYTAPASRREYYERNKEKEKQRAKDYQQRTNYKSNYKPTPEQKREYNKQAYLRRKEKLQNKMEEKLNNDII